MILTYLELNNCIEAMRTVVGSDKTGASNIVLLSNPAENILQFVSISANYQVIKTIQPEFFENDEKAEILVNFKKLSELVALSRTTSGIQTEIVLTIDTGRKELCYNLTKFVSTKDNTDMQAQRQVLSRIRQTIDIVLVSEDKRHGGLDAVNIDWLMKLENDSAENPNTAACELNDFINTMSKMILGDAGQIIMSAQTHVIATCNSNYATYKESTFAAISVVFQASILSKILSILRTIKSTNNEENLIILHKYDSRLAIFDEKHNFVIQTDVPLARRLMLNHINGFNSADYSYAGAVIRRDIFLDTIKCFETLTNSNQANIRIIEDADEHYLRLEVPNSNSRQNDMVLKIQDMRGDISVVNKTFSMTLSTLVQMLNTCDARTICMSIALPEIADENSTETAQPLLKIANIQENNTESLKCYSILA